MILFKSEMQCIFPLSLCVYEFNFQGQNFQGAIGQKKYKNYYCHLTGRHVFATEMRDY